MRLLSFSHGGTVKAGVRDGDRVIALADIALDLPTTIRQLIEAGALSALPEQLKAGTATGIPIADIEYRPVIPDPGKILCIGRNYAAHAAEGGAETPTYPEVFFRGATSLVAHDAAIVRPQCSTMLDYEGEIALVIGRKCRHASAANALDYVAGYTLFNDATLRDYQGRAKQWTMGKNFDGTGAFGPELVTADELPGGVAGLTLTTVLNGETMQQGNTDDLVFPVVKLIEQLSECMTLEPGDVVVTGTPSGVGFARTPQIWMKPGDRVEVHVPGLGTLANTIIDEVMPES